MDRRSFLASAGSTALFTGSLYAQTPQQTPPPELPQPILKLKNRRDEAVPISLTEREARFEKARSLMRTHGMDAIAIAGSTSLTYYTGMRWGNSERMFLFVLPVTGAAFFICPVFEEERVRERLVSVPAVRVLRSTHGKRMKVRLHCLAKHCRSVA
jgi:Xaa-Pro dipeptidase